MKSKRGFTLVEIIMVLAVLAVVSVITIPRALGTIDASKKESLTAMAKSVIQTSKLYLSTDTTGAFSLPDSGSATLLTFEVLDLALDKTPYGDNIDKSNSYVFVDSTGNYYVTITTSVGKKGLKNIKESALEEDYSVIKFESDNTNNLGTPDASTITSVSLDDNGDGVFSEGSLTVNLGNLGIPFSWLYIGSTPTDSETITGDLIIEFRYLKDYDAEFFVDIDGVEYYLFSSSVGTTGKAARTCKEIYAATEGAASSGIYYVNPSGTEDDVYCDMSNDNGRMLFANFKGSYGSTTDNYGAAIGTDGSHITGSTTLSTAGWSRSYSHIDYSSYTIRGDSLQMFYTGTPQGYVSKTLTSYADNVFVRWYDNHSGTAYLSIGGTTVQSSSGGEMTYTGTYSTGNVIKFFENSSIIWPGEIWVWETDDNLVLSTIDSDYDSVSYTFTNVSAGNDYTFQIKGIVDGEPVQLGARTVSR